MGERVPFTERKLVVGGTVAVATVVVASLGLPKFADWLTTREETALRVQPPTGKVERYSALVTGTASSDFDVSGSKECGVGSMNAENSWHAVATVANKIGDFTVAASADHSSVVITLEQYPELDSGLQMDRSRTDSNESGIIASCSGNDLISLTASMMLTAQAAADTIGDCVVQRPDFLQGLHDQLQAFGQAAYPEAVVTVADFPAMTGPSESVSALDALRAEFANDGIGITASPVDNCEFAAFEMTPIVFTPGGVNG